MMGVQTTTIMTTTTAVNSIAAIALTAILCTIETLTANQSPSEFTEQRIHDL